MAITISSKQNRLQWLDNMRGIAFLLIVYSHLEYYRNDNLMSFFYPVYLTTFFFVSGYLFKSDYSFKQLLEHRTRTLLIPFFIFGILLILMSQTFTFKSYKHLSFSKELLGFLFQSRGTQSGLWFIAALFVMNFPFYFLVKYIKNIKILLSVSLGIFLLSSIYVFWLKLPALPWHIQWIGGGCFYMTLGFVYKKYEGKIKSFEKNPLFFSALLLYLLFIGIRNFFLHLSGFMKFNGSFYFIDALIITLLGIFIMIYVSKKLKNVELVSFVGTNSLLYFCLHGKVLSFLEHMIVKIFVKFDLGHSNLTDFFLGAGITLLDVLVVIIPVIFINKYLPFLIGKGFTLHCRTSS